MFLIVGAVSGGCARMTESSADVYERAREDRVAYLEREVERLQADVRGAEEAMIAMESGLRGIHTRADAVSSLAEARISLDRARDHAPWRTEEADEAQAKLLDAERQMKEGHVGTSLFFSSRAQRIADGMLGEAQVAEATPGALFVRGQRVNLRSGPGTDEQVVDVLNHGVPVFEEKRSGDWMLVRTFNGRVGWVHARLVGAR
jgi:hypothetical protein